MRLLKALLLLPAAALADDAKPAAEPAKKKTAAELDIPDPGTPVEDPAIAKQEIARFEKEMKEAKGAAKEVELLERLGGWDHPDVLKTAAKYMKDREVTVAVAAVVAVARQGKSKEAAGKTLFGLLRTEKRTDIICAAVVAMGKLGYDHKNAVKEVMGLYQRDTRETHKAATRYFGYIRYKPAFRLLAEKLEAPQPIPENDRNPGANPPESYWKERWHEWNSNVPHTRWALAQMVEGETFETTAEAKQWAETEGSKHGIEW